MRIPAILLAVGGLGLSTLLGGCYEMFPGEGVTHEYHDYIPGAAYTVGNGTGTVSYIADKPGTVYLIDWNRSDEIAKEHYAPHVIGNYVLRQGQGISVDGSTQMITLGSTGMVSPTVFKNQHLSTENSYELRFESEQAGKTF